MKIILDYASSVPMYEQIKNIIKDHIYNGELKDNDALPSMRQLAKELEVSMITTKRAYMELEREGFIYTVSGRGTFIKIPDFSKVVEGRRQKLLEEYGEYIRSLKEMGIEKKDMLEIITEVYEG